MAIPRPFALVQSPDQWLRSTHAGTALDPETGIVELMRLPAAPVDAGGVLPAPAGLAFDPWCRLYHSRPEAGQVERMPWTRADPLEPVRPLPAPVDLFAEEDPGAGGDFAPVNRPGGPLRGPSGLAVDDDGHLFVAETGALRILVYDLWESRLLRRVPTSPARPLDLAAQGRRVQALLADPQELVTLEAQTGPQARPLPDGLVRPGRIAIGPQGRAFVLDQPGTEDAAVVAVDGGLRLPVAFASDLEFQADGALVVARRPGADLLRFVLGEAGPGEAAPLKGQFYDGRGIVRTPDGRIGFWTAKGFRHAVSARPRYVRSGRLTTFLLDSGRFRNTWGRLFLDACIPAGASVHVHCAALDEPDDPPPPRAPPANLPAAMPTRPELSPLPPTTLVPAPEEPVTGTLHRRATGIEQPWRRRAHDDPFETYEAPARTGPGRYFWVTLELAGNGRVSPRVRSLRVERESHDLLRRLPRVYADDAPAANFLTRYLAICEGLLGDFDARASARHTLIDPWSAPEELLPWLASFIGLVLDERLATLAKRRLIEDGIMLFRLRGTIPGLARMLEIVTGTPPVIVEHWRLRGLGGALIGGTGELASRSVLGLGFRIGGAIGEPGEVAVAGGQGDAFGDHAHRFSVVVRAGLEAEQLALVRHLLEVHRPAHTLVDLCLVDAGMRVGVGLYAELTSMVGRTGGFVPLRVGSGGFGRCAVVGRPHDATRPGASRVGHDSRIG